MNLKPDQWGIGFMVALLMLTWGWIGSVQAATTPASLSIAQIDQARQRMQRFLLARQDGQTGSWETRSRSGSSHYGHTTALVTYSLLQSGLSYQAPSLARAVHFLSEQQSSDTYTLYPRFLCWSILPDRFTPHLNADARLLMRAQRNGLFHISSQTDSPVDTRLLLYGTLGLHIASQRGISIAPQAWESITNHLLGVQHNSGGWGDTDAHSSSTTVSATVSAMTVLHICRLQLAKYPHAMGPITSSLERAERYLSRHGPMEIPSHSQDKTHSYEAALYSLYQLAMLTRYSGVQTYGGQDWFRQGVQTILELEGGRGSIRGDLVETSFALLFLSQAGASVWMNRLDVPATDAGSGIADIHLLTRRISQLREYDLHWQVVRPDDPLAVWLTAPMLHVSSDLPLSLTEEQSHRLKRYLDTGGLLVASPRNSPRNSSSSQSNSQAFTQSVIQLAQTIYPELSFTRLPADHPAVSLLQPVEGVVLRSLSTGARDLIILAEHDLHSGWSAKQEEWRDDDPALRLWYNLYAWTTDRGTATTRLDAWVDAPNEGTPARQWSLVRATYSESAGQERMAWPLYGIRLRNRSGIELSIRDQPLAEIGSCESPLVHLAGMTAHSLTEAQKQAILQYLERGGTLLVESVGGQNDFASSIRAQLESLLGVTAIPLTPQAALLQPQPTLQASALQRTPFRSYSVLKHGYAPFPRLTALEFRGRQAVLFSDDDLTLGLLRLRRWGINGYRPEAADAIASHLLAWTAGQANQLKPNAVAQQSMN